MVAALVTAVIALVASAAVVVGVAAGPSSGRPGIRGYEQDQGQGMMGGYGDQGQGQGMMERFDGQGVAAR
jgi:hypothetical protein